MRNPLRKRLLREITGDIGKYLVIFIMLVLFIGFVSGFIVADSSMLKAYNDGFTKYNIEDGHFLTVTEMNRAQKKAVEALGITVYDQYYVEKQMENNTKLRIYADRKEVNTLCVMDGVMPSAEDEIALDRMYAENNGLKVGDTVSDGGITWKITALVALPDYSCLFEDNSDTMFDSVKFGVAVVSDKGFERFDTNSLNYDYAWKYHEKPAGEIQEKERSEDLLKGLADEVTLSEYLPLYQNQAIQFTGDDITEAIIKAVFNVMALAPTEVA
ncbi:MAG: ABC transporter permease, partial [Lachnospiraceae bacterium]|nr:ABC transporter permease [Lachnospiraceae bacterium]